MVDIYSNFWELETLPKNLTAASVIQYCKRNFSQHGLPDVVVADTAQQVYRKELEQFAKEWFECSLSDLYHSQLNGKAKSAMKIAKKLIKKTELDGSNLWKAILD